MDWFLYYDVAQDLVGNDGEAYKRSAVSRAYYAMYGVARSELVDYLEDEYSPPDCGSEHMYVWNSYREDRHPRGTRQIGVLGNRLRRHRNTADYEGVVLNLPDLVEDAMSIARDLKGHLEGLRV